jgi:hypothetical protein
MQDYQKITIQTMLNKYQRIEAEFMTKEIQDFKTLMLQFRGEFYQIMNTLEATHKPEDRKTVSLLESFCGKREGY